MKIIALDIGLKRIGLALSDGRICLPLKPVLRQNRKQAASDVSKVLQEYKADTLVAGVPMGGASEGEMKRRVEHFVKLLDFKGEICFVDESFSSSQASELQAQANSTNKHKDGKLDSLSAMIILQRFLDSKKI